jgi:hypothetical protein
MAASPMTTATGIISGMIVMVMMMSPPATAVPAAPAKAPARTVPAVPSPAIVRITAPTIRVIAPIPPQAVGECRKCICVQSVRIYIPVPWIQTINYIPVKRAADTDGIAWIAETDNARGIFIIIFRTVKTVHPFSIQVIVFFFVYIKRIILL